MYKLFLSKDNYEACVPFAGSTICPPDPAPGRAAPPAPPGSSSATLRGPRRPRRAARGTAGCRRRFSTIAVARGRARRRPMHEPTRVGLSSAERVEHEQLVTGLRQRRGRLGSSGREADDEDRERMAGREDHEVIERGRAASARPSGCPRRRRRADARRRPPRASGGRPRTSPRSVLRRRPGRPRRAPSARSRRRAARRRARDRRAA